MATEVVNGQVQDVSHSAVQYVREQLGLQVCAVAQLTDLLGFLQTQSGPETTAHLAQVQAYRERYGVA
jgi:orotate phosphoribosyltransferase